MNLGDTLFYFRDSLDITKTEFCSSSVTASYYSRVEKNENDIAFSKLLSILKKNNITPYEFYYRLNDGKEEPFITWYKQLKKAYYNSDTIELQSIISSIPEDDYFYCVGNCLLQTLNGTSIKNKSILVKYLSNLNRWTEYHILLFLLGTKFFSVKELIFLFGTFSKNIENLTLYAIYEKDIILSLLNIVESCLKQKNVDEARYFLQVLPQVMTDPFYLFERTMINFYNCFINAFNDINADTNIEECYKIILNFKKYSMDPIVKLLNDLMTLYSF